MVNDMLLVAEHSAHPNRMIYAAVEMAERMSADLTIEVLPVSPLLLPALAPMTTICILDWAMAKNEAQRFMTISNMVANSASVLSVISLRDDVTGLARRGGPVADLVIMGGTGHWETHWLRRRVSETIVMGAGGLLLIPSYWEGLTSDYERREWLEGKFRSTARGARLDDAYLAACQGIGRH